jgi:hypothetical protein
MTTPQQCEETCVMVLVLFRSPAGTDRTAYAALLTSPWSRSNHHRPHDRGRAPAVHYQKITIGLMTRVLMAGEIATDMIGNVQTCLGGFLNKYLWKTLNEFRVKRYISIASMSQPAEQTTRLHRSTGTTENGFHAVTLIQKTTDRGIKCKCEQSRQTFLQYL